MASKQSLFFFSLLFLQQLRFSASQSTVKAAYWYSELEFSADDIDSSLFTVLYCSFAKLNSETFQVYIPPQLTQKFATFTSTVKRKNPSVKTLLSIGGGRANKADYIAMASDWNRRQAFIQSSIRLARDNNFHGLDLDWEYPADETQMTQFGYLVDEWRTAVADEASDTGRSRLLLAAAVFYSPDYYSVPYVVPALARSLDWINVMAYDFYTPASVSSPSLTKPPAALYKDPTERYGGDAGVSSWIGEGFPAKKIVLGLPFYGYAWRLVDANRNGLYAPANGPALSGDSAMGYTEIREFIADHQNDGKAVFNGAVVADYCYGGTTWIGYDDVQSISGKVSYAKDKGLLGYFGWHIGADADMVLSREG
ncbi:hypothetical protein L484_022978 [Morus notabilis]|uniref:GH18 domain-containing protein n=1 Tax=Morus notabilis TaxID=981085 RepID=W9RT75_9ROSA|nr:hypothetical protein L484_022978 [Morus notabilis]